MRGALTWGEVLLVVFVGALALASLISDRRQSSERARIKRLEADIARREAKYLQLLADKAKADRALEAAKSEAASLRDMLGDTTRRLFRRERGAA